MEHYVTVFDSAFLPQGIALHASLMRHAQPFKLWVVCMDTDCFAYLSRLTLDHLVPLPIADLETEALRAVKPGRSRAEYCWTITPFTADFVFDRDASISRVTYLDADLYFLASPNPLFEEFESSGKSVLITEHAFAPEYDSALENGRFCVQFMVFVRDRSDRVRHWWQQKCLEWCFARNEPGRFGDQKYLDDWPQRFPDDVHVLAAQHLMLGPWNATRFPVSGGVVYHFHGLRVLGPTRIRLWDSYVIPGSTYRAAYRPYRDTLCDALELMARHGISALPQARERPWAWIVGAVQQVVTQVQNFQWRRCERIRRQAPFRD